jgi:hypothetical protein
MRSITVNWPLPDEVVPSRIRMMQMYASSATEQLKNNHSKGMIKIQLGRTNKFSDADVLFDFEKDDWFLDEGDVVFWYTYPTNEESSLLTIIEVQ